MGSRLKQILRISPVCVPTASDMVEIRQILGWPYNGHGQSLVVRLFQDAVRFLREDRNIFIIRMASMRLIPSSKTKLHFCHHLNLVILWVIWLWDAMGIYGSNWQTQSAAPSACDTQNSKWNVEHDDTPLNLGNLGYIHIYLGKLFCDLTATSVRPNPGIMVSKGNYPNMVLFQVSELLYFAQIYTLFSDKATWVCPNQNPRKLEWFRHQWPPNSSMAIN